jgi:adhesin HecA-like repeat protein
LHSDYDRPSQKARPPQSWLTGNDVINLADDASFAGSVTLAAETLTNSNGVLTADTLLLSNVQNAGTETNPITTQINQLQLQNITGDVYLHETDALLIENSFTSARAETNGAGGVIKLLGVFNQAATLHDNNHCLSNIS